MEVLEAGVEGIVAVVEGGAGFIVAVYACSERVFEVCDSCAVNEVVQVLLWCARRLEDGFYRGVTQDGEGRLQACKGGV